MKMTKVNQNKDVRQQTLDNRQQMISHRTKVIKLFWVLCLLSFVSGLSLLSGCNSGNEIPKLKTQIDNLKEENTQLTKEIDKTQSENKDLESQITVLQNLPDNVKGQNLYTLETVKIQNYSTLYDENNDGKIDTLIVRIQPIDNYGDLIKAAGSVNVELWNLNKPEDQALIGKWQVSSEELKKLWNDTLITNYRLSFDVSGKVDKFDEPLTLKVVFTDYLSGKTFNEQKVIEP